MKSNSILTSEMLDDFKAGFPGLFVEFERMFSTKIFDELVQFYRKPSIRRSEYLEFLFSLIDNYKVLLVTKDYDGAWLIREIIDTVIYTFR